MDFKAQAFNSGAFVSKTELALMNDTHHPRCPLTPGASGPAGAHHPHAVQWNVQPTLSLVRVLVLALKWRSQLGSKFGLRGPQCPPISRLGLIQTR
jgi:microcystin-dependent protein